MTNTFEMILAIVAVLLVCLFLLVKNQYSHWENVGIPNVKPKIPFGNLQSLVKKERSFGTAIYDIYKQTSEPFIGIYLFFRPAILVRDRELVKNILTKDFQNFHDRGVYCEPKSDPMSGTLFALPGEAWKSLRMRLTPAFTSGKLKGMYPTIQRRKWTREIYEAISWKEWIDWDSWPRWSLCYRLLGIHRLWSRRRLDNKGSKSWIQNEWSKNQR